MYKLLIISYIILLLNCNGTNTRSFIFNYEVSILPTNDKKLELWIPYPNSNEVQNIKNIKVDADGLNYTIEVEKKHNNKYLYFFSDNGTDIEKNIKLSFEVTRKEHKNINYVNVDPNNYLSSASMVPTGSIFDKIIKDNKLTSQNMRGIYDYVLNGMHYGKPTDDQNSKNYKYIYGGKNPNTGQEWLPSNITYGLKKVTKDQLVKSQNNDAKYSYGNGNSLYACDIGVGNCTDYHSYFMSLSRTLKTPSRFHMGFPIPNGEEGKVKGYHCWADYYIKGEGWYPVDISEADKDHSKVEYFFGTVDESRVEMMVGRDFILKNYDQGEVNLFIYPILEINDQKSNKFKKSFFYRNI